MKIVVSLAATLALGSAPAVKSLPVQSPDLSRAENLTVLTYNIKGLPWPVASGRPEALAQIAAQLRAMRVADSHPDVVVLQEAFTDAAKAIGRDAGYRYIVSGPSTAERSKIIPTPDDRRFIAEARWLKGETQGKLVDSGLQILSDYPVLYSRRAPFPRFACAGYDCLANKGVLLAAIAVPGASAPVVVVTTHLNSRNASGVSDARSAYAYRRQIDTLNEFLAMFRNSRSSMIFAGDFNANERGRRSYLFDEGTSLWSIGSSAPIRTALDQCLLLSRPCGRDLPPLTTYVQERARDWQFYSAGADIALEATGLEIPFGIGRDGGMLSDHVGYSIVYRMAPARAAPKRLESSTKFGSPVV